MSAPYETLTVEQGSELWLKERMTRVTASQIPALLGLSPYQTILDLYEEKITGKEVDVSSYKQVLFDKGHRAEAAARLWVEANLGLAFPPAVIVSKECPHLLASLDGINVEKNIIFEAKYMGKASLEDVKQGKIKEHHQCQIQAQLLASGAEKCIYFATIKDGDSAVLEVTPKSDYAERITAAVDKFMEELTNVMAYKQAYLDSVERLKRQYNRKGKDPFKVKSRYKKV